MLTHFLEPSLTPSCHGNNAVWNDVNDHAILHFHLKCCYELHRTHFCVCVAPFTHPRFYFCSNKSLCVIIMHNLKKSKHDIVNTLLFLLKRDHTAFSIICTGTYFWLHRFSCFGLGFFFVTHAGYIHTEMGKAPSLKVGRSATVFFFLPEGLSHKRITKWRRFYIPITWKHIRFTTYKGHIHKGHQTRVAMSSD